MSPLSVLRQLLLDTRKLSLALFKQMVPAILVVKLLEELGMVPWIGVALSPLMSWVGLPEELGLVWATAMLSNIYAGMVVYIGLVDSIPTLTGAQATVLATLMLVAHGLPVEARIAQLARVRLRATLLLRIGGALLFASALDNLYRAFDWLQEPQPPLWEPAPRDDSLLGWAVEQLQSLAMIVVIIFVLLALLQLLRAIGVEALICRLLRPLLRLIGIGEAATSVTLIGVTLGISFGGGLLVQEARSGHIPPRDLFLSMALLGLCHSLIEDTLALLLIGADFAGIFWGRLLLSLLAVALLARLFDWLGDGVQQRHLLRPNVTR